jgi:phosphonate transport system permease protein
MSEPDILLADEPIASLDQANARSVLRLLSELQRERGLTMVSVLHDCALAETFGDRLLTIVDGRVVHHTPARGVVHADCHACDHICAPTSLEPQISQPIGDRSAWRGTAATIGVLGVAGWCIHALGLTDVHTAGLLGQVARFVGRMVPNAGELVSMPWGSLMASMLATAQMSLLGTLMAAIIALPLSALAAKNVAPGLIATPVRVMLNVWRSVPSILWALLLVAAVGLGASAGVMALAAYSVGYLTKFFYEAFEQAERGAAGVLRDLGAGPLQRFVHAVWPASLPAVAAAGLFMVEYNLRAAGVLGIVGAGGIGQDLKMAVDWGNWHVVGVILAMFAITVIAVDAMSAVVRRRIMA